MLLVKCNVSFNIINVWYKYIIYENFVKNKIERVNLYILWVKDISYKIEKKIFKIFLLRVKYRVNHWKETPLYFRVTLF